MKTKSMFALLTAVSAFGFASEPLATTTELPLEVKQSLVDAKADRNWFGYMRVGPNSPVTDAANVMPGLGFGLRYNLAVGAIDVSTSYIGADAFASEKTSYSYTLPRISYLYYFSSNRAQSFYTGAGLAYGGVKNKDVASFNGILPSITVGYEMNRHQNWRSFVQLDVSHPTISTDLNKPFAHLANLNVGPMAEFSVGFGY